MAGIMVPKTRAETPTGGGDRVFPEGSFIGTIDEIYEQGLPPWAGDATNNGYASADGEVVSIQLGSNRSLDEGVDVGNQKMFVKFVVRDGSVTIDAGPNIPDASWQMQRDAALLTNLALALGATEEVEGTDGETYISTTDDFLDTLRSGGFVGQNVGFTTYHRNWTKGDKSGTEVRLSEFFEAV